MKLHNQNRSKQIENSKKSAICFKEKAQISGVAKGFKGVKTSKRQKEALVTIENFKKFFFLPALYREFAVLLFWVAVKLDGIGLGVKTDNKNFAVLTCFDLF